MRAAAFGGTAGELRIKADLNTAGGRFVVSDVEGDRVADPSILVVAITHYTLSATDFVL